MNCNEIINEYMSQYIENELNEEARARFEEHINNCENCRNELAFTLSIMDACGNIEEEELPENFKQELHQKLTDANNDRTSIFNVRNYVKVLSTVAAIVVIAVLVRGFTGVSPHKESTASYVQNQTAATQEAKDQAGGSASSEEAAQKVFTDGDKNQTEAYKADSPVATDSGSVLAQSFDKPSDITVGYKGVEGMQKNETVEGTQKNDDATRNGAAPENSDDQRALKQADAASFTTSAMVMQPLRKNSYVTASSDNPSAESAKINNYAASFGVVQAEAPKSNIVFTFSEPITTEATDTVVLNLKVPEANYQAFIDRIKADKELYSIEITPIEEIDLSAELDELNKKLANINKQIEHLQKEKGSTEELEKLKNEKALIELQIEDINNALGYIYISITIIKK